MVRRLTLIAGAGLVAAVSFAAVGCGASAPPAAQSGTPEGTKQPAAGAGTDEAHAHKPGAHGGILVSLGRDSYHAEAVFEKNGTVRLYMLGKDEARIQEVEVQELTAYVTADGSAEADKLVLRAEPQSGDAKGKTSQFVGTLAKELHGKKVQVTVNNINVNGERFRIAFSNAAAGGDHAAADMPAKRGNEEEVKLYLTPGGLYTAADIKANGNKIASEKFKGLRAEHDLKPKSGEKICPVTLTKASPKFSWVVGGKTYEFCCPPCVDEFVSTAKEKPGEIKEPEFYRKQ
jgi:YHS domain-containing protein